MDKHYSGENYSFSMVIWIFSYCLCAVVGLLCDVGTIYNKKRSCKINIPVMSSYCKVFRIIFLVFSLYLLGDAFFRWDGFQYYASFSEFVPSVALITIIWSILAVLFAAIIWLLLRIIIWFCLHIGLKVTMDSCLIGIIGLFALLTPVILIAKQQRLGGQLTYMAVFIIVLLLPVLVWIFRNKAEQWMHIIQERISPLIWLFYIITILSIPLVTYHTLWKKADVIIQNKNVLAYENKKNRPNIILVTFDALTARNMSVYGYQRPTSSFIAKWAKESSLFTKLEAESVITTPTVASLMTGKRLWTHQTYHLEGSKPHKADTENLPLLLKNNGYHTMAFVVNPYASVKKIGIENYFDIAPLPSQFNGPVSLLGHFDKFLYELFGDKIRLHDWIIQRDFIPYRILLQLFGEGYITAHPPENAFNKFLWAVDKNPLGPYFAWIHLYPPHDPYLPPKPFLGMFNSSSELRSNKSQYRVKKIGRRYRGTFQEFPPDVMTTINSLKDRYDEFIQYCDQQFQDLIAQLTKRNGLENTVIILSSDHGESFEHGAIQHSGLHLYEQVTHIPLIIKEPRQIKGRIINDLVEQIDIPATILDLAEVPIPSWMEGRSLLPLMHGQRISSRPAFSMTLMRNESRDHLITKGTIAVWEGDYKLIHYLDREKNMLFNLRQDPDEIQNHFDKEPEVSQRLLSLIQENLKKANDKIRERK